MSKKLVALKGLKGGLAYRIIKTGATDGSVENYTYRCTCASRGIVCHILRYCNVMCMTQLPELECFCDTDDVTRQNISEVIRKGPEISGIQDMRSKHKIGSTILKERTTPDVRNALNYKP
jgi:hypothetical protein